MLSNNKRLSLLIRKNSGRHKLIDYTEFFIDLDLKGLEYIELERSDLIQDRIREIFPVVKPEFEMITGDSELTNSRILSETFNSLTDDDFCYIYTDEVEECGMFKANAKSSLNKCLIIAKSTIQNTCFLIDSKFAFSILINYYDEDDRYDKDKFDIQRKVSALN